MSSSIYHEQSLVATLGELNSYVGSLIVSLECISGGSLINKQLVDIASIELKQCNELFAKIESEFSKKQDRPEVLELFNKLWFLNEKLGRVENEFQLEKSSYEQKYISHQCEKNHEKEEYFDMRQYGVDGEVLDLIQNIHWFFAENEFIKFVPEKNSYYIWCK